MVVALHEDAGGRPDRVELRGIRRDGRDGGESLVETVWSLAVRSADDLGAIRSLVRSAIPRSAYGTSLAVAPFLRRAGLEGTVTTRRLRVRRDGGETGLATPNAGVGVDSGRETEHLVSEATRLPGRPALPRDDCLDG